LHIPSWTSAEYWKDIFYSVSGTAENAMDDRYTSQFRFIIPAKSVISVKCKEFNVLLNCNSILSTQESLETCRTVFREFVLLCLLYCSCMALLCEICSNRVFLGGMQICVLG
jgi:hypothetical protein